MLKNKKMLYTVISTVVILLLAGGMYLFYRGYIDKQTVKGAKEITVQVVVDNNVVKEVTFRTDAMFLDDALDEQNLIVTEDFSWGRMVKQVAGYNTDDSHWWKLVVNDVEASVGITDVAIKDKDVIKFVYTEIDY